MRVRLAGLLLAFAYLTVPQPDQACFEDMPCWDCHSMGNKICGPIEGMK